MVIEVISEPEADSSTSLRSGSELPRTGARFGRNNGGTKPFGELATAKTIAIAKNKQIPPLRSEMTTKGSSVGVATKPPLLHQRTHACRANPPRVIVALGLLIMKLKSRMHRTVNQNVKSIACVGC